MRRRIPMYLLLATFVTSGSALAARTGEQAAGRATTQPAAKPTAKPAAPAPASAAAKGVPVKPADVAPLMGTWQLPLETPTGRLVANLVFRTEGGKVVAGVSAPNFAEHKITDVTKSGQVVTLKASTDYSGPLTSYSGPVTMVMTLRPKGDDLAAWLDFNNSGFQIGGTAKKKG
ncbi:MAG: hypothetical protein ABI051_03010 [Vicinamibacterales bacterium]